MRPLLLDLFCGAGGAAMGYHEAGFDVIGVDIKPQPHYPFEFILADALTFPLGGFHALHASPPCQAYSTTRTLHDAEYPMLIPEVRSRFEDTGLPYIIENVVGAPLHNPIRLCGSSFDLPIWRHRLFESDMPLMALPCAHPWSPEPLDVTGTGGPGGRHRKPKGLEEARIAMGIDWMARSELSEAIPPAYTRFIGEQLLEHLERVA